MQIKTPIKTVDVHCAGEIGRVIVDGSPDFPGETIADKLNYINQVNGSFRKLLCSEPRSAPAGSFCLLIESKIPEADMGLIILQPDQAHAMSGSNAMCTITAILETGLVPMVEPISTVTLDTAAGLVTAKAACNNHKVEKITLDMPPAFVQKKNLELKLEPWGILQYDIVFGGVFYALMDVDQLNLTITPKNARRLATIGVELHNKISQAETIVHPVTPHLNGLAYVMFRSNEPDGAVRTCTTMRPGRVDRSPCGTGSNSNMAVNFYEKKIKPGDKLVSRSIIGSEFVTEFIEETQVGPYPATKNKLTGQSWIYAKSEILLATSDPFQEGFILSDTWGE